MNTISIIGHFRSKKRGPLVNRLSSWVGFICYVVLAIRIVVQTPNVSAWMLPSFLHEFIIGMAFLTRQPLRRIASGFLPRAAAYSGTFLVPLFFTWAGKSHPQWLRLSPMQQMLEFGFVLWITGSLLSLWTVWSLRGSFSLVAQARSLITSGPYRWARHPIYACYLLQYLGLWLAHFSLPLGLMLLAWVAITAIRVHCEESVLQAEFPEYAQYKGIVGMFAPRLHNAPSLDERNNSSAVQGV